MGFWAASNGILGAASIYMGRKAMGESGVTASMGAVYIGGFFFGLIIPTLRSEKLGTDGIGSFFISFWRSLMKDRRVYFGGGFNKKATVGVVLTRKQQQLDTNLLSST
jgi:hypothetical protein